MWHIDYLPLMKSGANSNRSQLLSKGHLCLSNICQVSPFPLSSFQKGFTLFLYFAHSALPSLSSLIIWGSITCITFTFTFLTCFHILLTVVPSLPSVIIRGSITSSSTQVSLVSSLHSTWVQVKMSGCADWFNEWKMKRHINTYTLPEGFASRQP